VSDFCGVTRNGDDCGGFGKDCGGEDFGDDDFD
jgi:hypothetical protein